MVVEFTLNQRPDPKLLLLQQIAPNLPRIDNLVYVWQVPLSIGERTAEASLDKARPHTDDEYAAGTRFHQRLVHGIAFWSQIAGRLAGDGLAIACHKWKFAAPIHPGDSVSYRLAGTEEDPGLFYVEGLNRTIIDEAGNPSQIVKDTWVKVVPSWGESLEPMEGRVEGGGNRKSFPLTKSGEVQVRRPDGGIATYQQLPSIPGLQAGYEVGVATEVTESMIEAARFVTAREQVWSEVMHPYGVSRLLASLGGEDGAWTIIFLSLEGKIARGHQPLRKGSVFETRLRVESNLCKPDKRTGWERYFMNCKYRVDTDSGLLVGNGSASIMAEKWPFQG